MAKRISLVKLYNDQIFLLPTLLLDTWFSELCIAWFKWVAHIKLGKEKKGE